MRARAWPTNIQGLLTECRQVGRRAVACEKIETYWQIGDALLRHLEAEGGAQCCDQTIHNLSKDKQLGPSALCEVLRF